MGGHPFAGWLRGRRRIDVRVTVRGGRCGESIEGFAGHLFRCELDAGHELPHRCEQTTWAPVDGPVVRDA